MRKGLIAGIVAGVLALGALGWWMWQEQLEPLPLAPEADLWEKPNPEGEQDQAQLEILLAAGPGATALLRAQCFEPLLEKQDGRWTGLLAEAAWHSRHEKRWRFQVRSGLRFQDGRSLDAAALVAGFPVWAPAALKADLKKAQVVDGLAEFRFQHAQPGAAEAFAAAPVRDALTGLGTGPFRLSADGATLERSDFFRHGRSGFESLKLVTDPAALEGTAWAGSLLAKRWAFAQYPGKVPGEAMAQVRTGAYDDLRLSDGSVWFISRRLRRLRPDKADWTKTRLFGVWRADYELVRKEEP
ncbi:MAG TPA: hypothetical protein VJ623_12810 [Holophagaceae bacterium]|nr:hypothetical protein [Holophagaceae bacterium]